MLGKIFSFNLDKFFSQLVSIIFAVPVGQYLFGLFVSSREKKCEHVLEAEECREIRENMQNSHPITVLAAVAPILFIYIVFFISQWSYYMSGFTGKLPQGFSYSAYAREGFFQLCQVAVINLIIILIVMLRMNTDRKAFVIIRKALVITYSVVTLVLIATAIAKMVMYIDSMGLTPKRAYSTWFMLLLSVVFILLIIKQFVPGLNAVAVSMAVTVVFFAALALPDVDRMIVKYNVDRYIDGTLSDFDVSAMAELGDSAIPELVRLAEEFDRENGTDMADEINLTANNYVYYRVVEVLKDTAGEYSSGNKKLSAYTIPYIKAVHALEEAGMM